MVVEDKGVHVHTDASAKVIFLHPPNVSWLHRRKTLESIAHHVPSLASRRVRAHSNSSGRRLSMLSMPFLSFVSFLSIIYRAPALLATATPSPAGASAMPPSTYFDGALLCTRPASGSRGPLLDEIVRGGERPVAQALNLNGREQQTHLALREWTYVPQSAARKIGKNT